jgi:hypothetical protein
MWHGIKNFMKIGVKELLWLGFRNFRVCNVGITDGYL